MLNSRRIVFKLGGSLLHRHDWPIRLQQWLEQQTAGEYYGIVGGGKLIDVMRDLDQLFHLSKPAMHWRCLDLLEGTYEIATELMPAFDRIASPEALRSRLELKRDIDCVTPCWVRVSAFYSRQGLEGVPTELQPAIGWETTSDSLAAFLAYRLKAQRCVLLKSCALGHLDSLSQAIDEGIVDSEMTRFQRVVPSIELCQL